jgi:hypothetical protein
VVLVVLQQVEELLLEVALAGGKLPGVLSLLAEVDRRGLFIKQTRTCTFI